MEPANWRSRASVPLVVFLAVLSFAVAAFLWNEYLRPLNTSVFFADNERDWFAPVDFVPLLAPVAVVVAAREAPLWGLLLSTIAGPVILGGAAYAFHDELAVQREGGEVFGRYTERFPPGELRQAAVEEQDGPVVDVCASQRRRPGLSASYCLKIDTTRRRGKEVIGGYRFVGAEGADVGIAVDCFGVSRTTCSLGE